MNELSLTRGQFPVRVVQGQTEAKLREDLADAGFHTIGEFAGERTDREIAVALRALDNPTFGTLHTPKHVGFVFANVNGFTMVLCTGGFVKSFAVSGDLHSLLTTQELEDRDARQ